MLKIHLLNDLIVPALTLNLNGGRLMMLIELQNWQLNAELSNIAFDNQVI